MAMSTEVAGRCLLLPRLSEEMPGTQPGRRPLQPWRAHVSIRVIWPCKRAPGSACSGEQAAQA